MDISLRQVFADRLSDFQEQYDFSEVNEAVGALANTGELIGLICGERHATLAMTAIRGVIAHTSAQEWNWSNLSTIEIEPEWRDAWSMIDGHDVTGGTKFLDELHDLNAFANFGILPTWGQANLLEFDHPNVGELRKRLAASLDVPLLVEGICNKIDLFEKFAPRLTGGEGSIKQMCATRNQARARIKLDQTTPITIHELALLSGVTVKRIQNAVYAKTDEAPIIDKNGLISNEGCHQWLSTRDYHRSIWKQISELGVLENGWGASVMFEETESDRVIDDFVFVPVANDGTMFAPNLFKSAKETARGFKIGAKGSELTIVDFDEALDLLSKMETPRWRRPQPESGIWGIVTGQTWKRIRRTELEGLTL